MKRVALYLRVSTVDQHPETQKAMSCGNSQRNVATKLSKNIWIMA